MIVDYKLVDKDKPLQILNLNKAGTMYLGFFFHDAKLLVQAL